MLTKIKHMVLASVCIMMLSRVNLGDAQFVELRGKSNMSFHHKHARELIIRPALKELDMWSESAEELLLLTLAVESDFGTYLRQNGLEGGFSVGRSPFSIEPTTLRWLKNVFPQFLPIEVTSDDLVTDLKLAAKVARLRYRVVKAALPNAEDTIGLASYWKIWYNASPNGGTIENAINKYRKYVKK